MFSHDVTTAILVSQSNETAAIDARHVSENTLYDTGYYFVLQAITFLTSDFADVASTIPSAKRGEVKAEKPRKMSLNSVKTIFCGSFFRHPSKLCRRILNLFMSGLYGYDVFGSENVTLKVNSRCFKLHLTLIPFHSICQILGNFSGINSK